MSVVNAMYGKWRRDEGIPLSARCWKAKQYVVSSATAPLWLHGVDQMGRGVRCIGRPVISNLGSMHLSDLVVLRSRPVSVELATGPLGQLRIGSRTSINCGVSIHAEELVEIGEGVRIAPYVHIMDTAFHDLSDHNKRPDSQPVFIHDDVWICVKSTILPGVTIGRGAVVGAHSVVTKDVPAGAIVTGAPARIVADAKPSDRPGSANLVGARR